MAKTFVQPIIPPPLDVRRMQDPIRKALKRFADVLQANLYSTVRTWKTQPKFSIDITPFSFGMTKIEISFRAPGEQGQIWRWTDEGTKPHIIRPKPGNKVGLIFPTMFTPKTSPSRLRARAGSSGGPIRVAQKVRHPGTKPRHFSERIAKDQQSNFEKTMEKAMADAAKASGHAV